MNEKLVKDLENIEEESRILDLRIAELKARKRGMMNAFLSTLPFQEGDKVKDAKGNVFIIGQLKDAFFIGRGEIKVRMTIRKIKKNGEPYQCAQEAWGVDYFSLSKVNN